MTGAIWLVRHASTEWTGRRWLGRRDLPLSVDGRAEAAALAGSLGPIVPSGTIVVASPARRAIETAAPLAERLGTAVACDPDLREVDVGRLEGLTWDEVRAKMPELAAAVAAGQPFDWPAGETWAQLSARVAAAWRRLEALGRPVVAVTHAGVIAGLVAALVPDAPPRWVGGTGVVAFRRDATGDDWRLDEAPG